MKNGIIRRPFKGKSLLVSLSDYVAVDLETTGLSPSYDSIIEFAAVKIESQKVVAQFQSLVDPGYPLDPYITHLTGITDKMLSGARHIDEVLPEFLAFVGDSVIVGHNVNFDINFIYDKCMQTLGVPFRNDFVDTMRVSKKMFPEHRHHRLSDLIERFSIAENVEHRALSDALQTAECYEYMKEYDE